MISAQERLQNMEQRVTKAHHDVMVAVDNLIKTRDPKGIEGLASAKAELNAACKEAHDLIAERNKSINESFLAFMETLMGESVTGVAGRGMPS